MRTAYSFFFSPTGTTRRVAAALAQALDMPTVGTDLTCAAVPATEIGADDLAVLAAPVYGGRIPPLALERMAAVRGNGTPAVIVVVYGNRAFEGAARELAAWARSHGFRPVAAAAFVGEHSYSSPATPIAVGRPDSDDLAAAAAFGARIREKLRSGDLCEVAVKRLKTPHTPLLPLLRFIGSVVPLMWKMRAAKEAAVPFVEADACTRCGRCAAHCPTQAIARGDCLHTDPTRCIRCCACVKGCPAGARRYDTPFSALLARDFARRKPPVTLL